MQAAEVAPALGRAFRRARAAMRGDNQSLEAALAEIRRLESERVKIKERLAAHSLRFRRYAESLDEKFKATGDIADEAAARLAWLIVAEDTKKAAPLVRYGALPAGVSTIDAAATKEFIGKFDWRPPLAEVARIRVAVAAGHLQQIEAEVKESFVALNLDEDINDDRRVKRLRRRVDRWEMLQASVAESDGMDWFALTTELSEGDTE